MPQMVFRLLEAERQLRRRGEKVAAVAPQLIDNQYPRASSFIRQQGLRRRRIQCDSDAAQFIQTDYVISSGALIACDTLAEVGEMDESLFIDYVDIEWGLRAQSKGFHSYGVCNATLEHRLGDSIKSIPWAGAFRAPVRVPLRHYYYFRNAIRIYRRPYVSRVWAMSDAMRLLLKFAFYALITPPRVRNLKMMSLGVWHGLLGRGGSYTAIGPNR